jgi:hypothetical protein
MEKEIPMNSFDTAIKNAVAKGWPEGARRMRMEKRVASALVKGLLGLGYTVTIDNGEDKPVEKGTRYTQIMNELWQTDEEHVLFHDGTGKTRGWFFLVYGNDGYDLISDYSANDATEYVYREKVEPVINRLEAGL